MLAASANAAVASRRRLPDNNNTELGHILKYHYVAHSALTLYACVHSFSPEAVLFFQHPVHRRERVARVHTDIDAISAQHKSAAL